MPHCAMASRNRVRQKEWETMPWDNYRRTVCTETTEATYEMQKDRLGKKRDARMKRYRGYKVYYYGDSEEQNQYKSQLRQEQQQQLLQLKSSRKHFSELVAESEKAAQEDRQSGSREEEEKRKHREFLTKFRDDNKVLIELHAEQRKAERKAQLSKEKELLRYNPINWNHSLW